MKKFLSLLTVIALILSFAPAAMAVDAVEVSDANGLIAAVTNDSKIKLVQDIELTARLTVKKNITLDLNGCKISADFEDAYGTVYVGTAGNLTITDSSANKTGAITSKSYAVGNYGTVTIDGGSFTADEAALYNFFSDSSIYGKATINNGVFNSPVWNCGTLTVAGGTLEYLDNTSKLTTTGGEIKALRVKTPDYAGLGMSTSIAAETTVGTLEAYDESELKNAVAAARAGDSITVMDDITISESIYINAGQSVTLDLNGYTLTGPDDGVSNWYAFIVNGGTLILDDASDAQTGNIFAKCYGIETKSGSFTMNGGKIIATNNKTLGTAIVNYGGDVVINDGEIVTSVWGVNAQAYFGDATVEINGGKFTLEGATSDAAVLIQVGGEYNTNTTTATIASGTFAGSGELALDTTTGTSSLTVKGGSFTTDPAEFLAPGYVVGGGDGDYGVNKYVPPYVPSTPVEPEVTRIFGDVDDEHTFVTEIEWAYNEGYVKGATETTYNPSGDISRQQLWMVLARHAGADPADMAAAKAWVVENGLSDGTNPGAVVSRQQMMTIIYRYAQLQGYDISAKADLSAYPDAGSVADYAADAMAWAVANGIVNGTAAGTLDSAGSTTRGQFAAILYRFCDKIA